METATATILSHLPASILDVDVDFNFINTRALASACLFLLQKPTSRLRRLVLNVRVAAKADVPLWEDVLTLAESVGTGFGLPPIRRVWLP
jgi:hypothetical protein